MGRGGATIPSCRLSTTALKRQTQKRVTTSHLSRTFYPSLTDLYSDTLRDVLKENKGLGRLQITRGVGLYIAISLLLLSV